MTLINYSAFQHVFIEFWVLWGLSRKSPAIVHITRMVTWHQCKLAAKESGLKCAYVNSDNFTVLVSRGGRLILPLPVGVYCVALTFKMTNRVEQWNCIKFCIKLKHSSTETVQMIQKATAVGSWWLAALSRCDAPYHASRVVQSFFVKHQITQVTQPLL